MRDWIYGFFMAWGMFLAIPCPKKIWSESARRKMLACLPLVGIVVGAVWALAAWLAGLLPRPLGAALCAAAPWLTTGFLHLDGFMDVCDGILSRRDLETRRRILKDSHCGAFAVICMVLLAMAQWSAFLSLEDIPLLPLALLPVASRASAAMAVLTLRPMSTSQYSAMERGARRFLWRLRFWRLCARCRFFCGAALPRWRQPSATDWRCGTASGSLKGCPAISPASVWCWASCAARWYWH